MRRALGLLVGKLFADGFGGFFDSAFGDFRS